jgi:glutathione synthase/RimK-type ligase-like ATP-grasp enzyme
VAIAYIYASKRITPEERAIFDYARRWRIKVLPINAVRHYSEKKLSLIAKKCRTAILNSAEPMSLEMAKVLEYYGTKIIDPTHSFYYSENKWMFYVKCRRHRLPTPRTILVPYNIVNAREELKKFILKSGAVIVKRVDSDNGDCVEKAKNVKEAMKIIKKIRNRVHVPIIAQEYIRECHKVFRVLIVGDKIIQSIYKRSKGWKCTGNYFRDNAPTFKVTPSLKKMCLRAARFLNLPWCGFDIMRKNGGWVFIEANSSPALNFITEDIPRLCQELFKFAVKTERKRKAGK